MNIVAVEAHQDDVELGCLGTLLKYRQVFGEACSITIVCISNGDKGAQFDLSISYEEIAAIRNAEAAAVASALGGRYLCLGQPDEYIQDTPAARDWLIEVIRSARADLVLTCPPVDYQEDHIVTSRLTNQATFLAPVRTIYTDSPPLDECPRLFYYDAIAGFESQPTRYVDISDVFERKLELIRLHKSQMQNMDKFGGWDLVTYCQVVNRFRGLQAKVNYAEGFTEALAWPRVRASQLLV